MNTKTLCLAFLVLSSAAYAGTLADKDTDKDGKVSAEEFAGDDKKLQKKFKKLDKDKDGFLSAEEFDKLSAQKNKKKDKK
jgi:Ca2+-binding EF-hand superfamily protein